MKLNLFESLCWASVGVIYLVISALAGYGTFWLAVVLGGNPIRLLLFACFSSAYFSFIMMAMFLSFLRLYLKTGKKEVK